MQVFCISSIVVVAMSNANESMLSVNTLIVAGDVSTDANALMLTKSSCKCCSLVALVPSINVWSAERRFVNFSCVVSNVASCFEHSLQLLFTSAYIVDMNVYNALASPATFIDLKKKS